MSFGAVMVALSLACSSEQCLGWISAWEMLANPRFGPPDVGRPNTFVSCQFGRWIGRSRFNSDVVGLWSHAGGVDGLHAVHVANARRNVHVGAGGRRVARGAAGTRCAT